MESSEGKENESWLREDGLWKTWWWWWMVIVFFLFLKENYEDQGTQVAVIKRKKNEYQQEKLSITRSRFFQHQQENCWNNHNELWQETRNWQEFAKIFCWSSASANSNLKFGLVCKLYWKWCFKHHHQHQQITLTPTIAPSPTMLGGLYSTSLLQTKHIRLQ